MKLGLLVAAATLALAMPLVSAQAATMTYTISGNGSGNLGGTAFNNADFSFTLVGDTANLSGNELNPLSSATASIAGFADTTFLISTRLGQSSFNAVYFSRTSGLDLFDFSLAGPVDLGTDFGPLTGTSVFTLNQFQGVATSGGALSFNASSDVQFSGTGAVTPGVPEPASWALMIAGFGLVGASMRRRRAAVAA